MKIRNRESLLSTGDIRVRKILLDIVEESLQCLDAYGLIKNVLKLEGNILRIGDLHWDLSLKRRIFVVGAGKACNSMSKAVEEVLGNRISQGIGIAKQIDLGDELNHIELVIGGHPLPNREGLSASQRILKMVDQATPEDLFISVISGGSSTLMTCPVPGITLEDEITTNEVLLKSGARIVEINAIRRHISMTNGGRLMQKVETKGAEMINLIISDAVGESPTINPAQPAKVFGTPVAPDNTTIQDARNVLRKYNLVPRIPNHVIKFLEADDPALETPKSYGDRIHQFVLQRPADSCEMVKKVADKMGLHSIVLTTLLEGESREAGTFLATVAKEISLNHRPILPPCLLIAGGETTTKISGRSGQGGPSQELALSFALEIAGLVGFGIAAIDTDGTDGPTDIAGGIGDVSTAERARVLGLDVYQYLNLHDSSTILKLLRDEIITGNTGTNVCDLNVIYVS